MTLVGLGGSRPGSIACSALTGSPQFVCDEVKAQRNEMKIQGS